MSFVALDDKSNCVGYYSDGDLHFESEVPKDLARTWKYFSFLHNEDIEYAYLYCDGKSLDEVCPEELKPEWDKLCDRMKAYIRSFQTAKINLNELCFYDLVPEQFLKEFFNIKCRIIDHVFDTHSKPPDYDFRFKLQVLLEDIRSREPIIDRSVLLPRTADIRVRNFINRLKVIQPVVSYDQFSSKTGRLTTAPATIPILTMDKSFRSIFKPKNDFFLELDYNAAELRVLLALNGLEQPDNDIHQWNMEQISASNREEAKRDFFAWLYGSSKVDGEVFEKLYSVRDLKEKYWDGETVTNHFGRKISSDEFHSVNYIVQSTAADLVLRQAIKVYDLLKGSKSSISFLIHDSIIIDLVYEERDMLEKIVATFSNTTFGEFKTNVSIGKDLNIMKEVKL